LRKELFVDWTKLKAEYIKGGTSYRKLADKYKVPFGTLRKVAAKEGWRELRDKTRLKTDTKLTDAVSKEQTDRLVRIHKVADDLLKQIEFIVSDFKREDLIMDKQCLKQITGALKDIKDIQSLKSPLDLEEQRARIDNLRRQSQKEDTNTEPIRIIIDDGASEYSK
jgi:hypothetical protein